MTSLLYALTIHPLELAYKYLYMALSGLTGNYGAALLGLSIVSTVIFGPLKQLAAAMQAREALIQKVMAPQLAAIKAQSKGAERQARIAALYKRYAYHPLMTLRSSFGILLQVPFLCAAYYMLSAFAPIQGQACWIIPDLGRPDGLLGGVNALPLLMTLCNIGAVYTTDGFTRRDRLQALLVAALFLLLLYGAPSALLIYWTGNNALMLLGNAWKHRPLPKKAGAAATFGGTLQMRSSGFYGRLAVKEELPLFLLAAFALSLTLSVFSPSMLYLTSPDYFNLPFRAILADLAPYGVLSLLLLTLVRILTPRTLRPYLTVIALTVSLVALVNTTLFTGNYGSLDGTVLSGASALDQPLLWGDALVLLCVLLFLALVLYFRQAKKLLLVMQATVLLLAGSGAAAVFKDDKVVAQNPSGLAEVAKDPMFAFSKTQTNVVVFFLDMFTGGHVGDIFAQNPDLAKRFAGFTWYPDTISVGNMTSASTPSIFGGPAYTPVQMNARPELTLHQKYSEALATLPRHFGARGFDAGIVHPPYTPDAAIFAKHSGGTALRIVDKPDLDGLISPWSRKIGADENALTVPNYGGFVFAVSLFKALPHAVKKSVYNEGRWLPGSTEEATTPTALRNTLYESAVLGLLPQLANTDSPKPTLKFIYSVLPHFDWHLPKDSLIPVADPYPDTEGQLVMVDGLMPEHVYTEKHILTMLAGFFDWLRKEGIYDNTMIILLSDHCEGDSRMLNAALGVNEAGERSNWPDRNRYPGRPHALLMVKALRDAKPLRADKALMSSMDVPALACRAIGGCEGLPMPDTGPSRVREHFIAREWRQIEIPGKTTYDPARTAKITGTMFKAENWSILNF